LMKTIVYCLADMKIDIPLYICRAVKINIADTSCKEPVSIIFKLVIFYVNVSTLSVL